MIYAPFDLQFITNTHHRRSLSPFHSFAFGDRPTVCAACAYHFSCFGVNNVNNASSCSWVEQSEAKVTAMYGNRPCINIIHTNVPKTKNRNQKRTEWNEQQSDCLWMHKHMHINRWMGNWNRFLRSFVDSFSLWNHVRYRVDSMWKHI